MPEQSSAKTLPNVLAGRAEGKESAGSPPRRPFLLLLSAITIPIIVLDQATKLFVQAHMALYESIALIPNYLDITYTLNPGAAFSMLADAPAWVRLAFLLSMSTVMSIVLIVLLARSERLSIYSFAFALILGGAVGNLIDRALRGGRVIDFMRAHYYDLNYPIFNVADSAISIGVTLIILASFFGHDDEPKPAN
ncbi:MAG TPA: signal peptidase II [Candidatus Binatus sp.]|uniref:signal peptidase II n=1 Tax=Candidatus Binatus sp. TaxID=2811406 RepID=UPI002B49D139|nr:signal peptidase II [Candidatus Binatus sp.]HKN13537.1 signal peptidase II [Candidatus Binatus sp.]